MESVRRSLHKREILVKETVLKKLNDGIRVDCFIIIWDD